MRKLALAAATLIAFMLPLTAQSADANPRQDRPAVSRAIDWD